MKIEYEKYGEYVNRMPAKGNHILAYGQDDAIVVYQAYNDQIANYALEKQQLGGAHYSYNRMSWIKPNFLWMMYRSGWSMKAGQENVLAIWIKKEFFDCILQASVYSSYQPDKYPSRETWQDDLNNSEVRLQWDPDHDPLGRNQERRAIQLGLKGEMLKEFGQSQILKIESVTEFSRNQLRQLEIGRMNEVLVPRETVYIPTQRKTCDYIGIDK